EARGLDGRCFLKVGADRLDAQRCQIRIRPATQDPHGIPPRQQLHHDGPAEKAPTAGDQRLHCTCPAAHRASLSLAIFTLWRTSTGKARWNRTVLIPAVTGCAAPSRSSSFLNRVTSSAVAGNLPGCDSMTITGRWCPVRPIPTRAERETSGC